MQVLVQQVEVGHLKSFIFNKLLATLMLRLQDLDNQSEKRQKGVKSSFTPSGGEEVSLFSQAVYRDDFSFFCLSSNLKVRSVFFSAAAWELLILRFLFGV